ncbi:MAG: translation initiation factor eIF-1A [Thermoplasmata archaeon]
MDEPPRTDPPADAVAVPDSAPAPTVPEVAEVGEDVGRLPVPRRARGEAYGIARQLLGAARIRVMCDDGIPRMGRITGKMKKKMWIREGDLLIIRPWGFQEGKSDILFRYSRTQAQFLSRRKLLPASVDIFATPEAEPTPTPPPPPPTTA